MLFFFSMPPTMFFKAVPLSVVTKKRIFGSLMVFSMKSRSFSFFRPPMFNYAKEIKTSKIFVLNFLRPKSCGHEKKIWVMVRLMLFHVVVVRVNLASHFSCLVNDASWFMDFLRLLRYQLKFQIYVEKKAAIKFGCIKTDKQKLQFRLINSFWLSFVVCAIKMSFYETIAYISSTWCHTVFSQPVINPIAMTLSVFDMAFCIMTRICVMTWWRRNGGNLFYLGERFSQDLKWKLIIFEEFCWHLSNSS